jgi:hypothetical protein
MWLVGRLAPDFKTIADFRRDNGSGIHNVCRRFVAVCRDLKLFNQALVAVDGSKFNAANKCDKNVTAAKKAMGKKRLCANADRGYYSSPQIKARADTGIDAILLKPTTSNAKAEGRFDRSDFIYIAKNDEYQCPAGQRAIHPATRESAHQSMGT